MQRHECNKHDFFIFLSFYLFQKNRVLHIFAPAVIIPTSAATRGKHVVLLHSLAFISRQ
jgi:hypothetical protein